MKKKKIKLLMIPLMIISFVACVYFGSDLLSDYKLRFCDVYVANTDITKRTLITKEYLKKISIPEDYLNEDTYTDLNDIVGKYVVSDGFIAKGSLFYKDYLEDVDKMNDGYFTRLEDNESSFDLMVKDININTASIKEGQYLDLYLTINRKEVISDLLISGARVVGLYDNKNQVVRENENTNISTITIALKKDMIPYLNKALAIGEISVSTNSNLYDYQDTIINLSEQMLSYLS